MLNILGAVLTFSLTMFMFSTVVSVRVERFIPRRQHVSLSQLVKLITPGTEPKPQEAPGNAGDTPPPDDPKKAYQPKTVIDAFLAGVRTGG